MRDDLIIVYTCCRFKRKHAVRRKFSFNFVFGTKNRNCKYFNLVHDVILKNIDKQVNIQMFSGGNKITNYSIFHNVTYGITFI